MNPKNKRAAVLLLLTIFTGVWSTPVYATDDPAQEQAPGASEETAAPQTTDAEETTPSEHASEETEETEQPDEQTTEEETTPTEDEMNETNLETETSDTPDAQSEENTETEDTDAAVVDTQTATISLELFTYDGVLLDTTLTVSACSELPESTTTTLTATCALEQAGDLLLEWGIYGDDMFLNGIDTYVTDWSTGLWWDFFYNQSYGSVALNKQEIHDGDILTFFYGVVPMVAEFASSTITTHTTTTISVFAFGLTESYEPVWVPATDITYQIGDDVYSDEDGVIELSRDTAGVYEVVISKSGYVLSGEYPVITVVDGTDDTTSEDVTTELPTTADVTVELFTPDGTLVDTSLTVTPCPILENSTTTTLSATCALEQATDLPLFWSTYGTSMFLDGIDTYQTDFSQHLYWEVYINHTYGMVGVNEQPITDGDLLTFVYGVVPLRATATTSTYSLSETAQITVEESTFTETYEQVWVPATNIVYSLSTGFTTTSADGIITFTQSEPGTVTVDITKTGYALSGDAPVIMFTSASHEETTGGSQSGDTSEEITHEDIPISSGGGGGSSTQTLSLSDRAARAVAFLDNSVNEDSTFGDSISYSDWVALAFAAWSGQSTGREPLRALLLADPNPIDGPNVTTAYARRAMALMALGINPYTGTNTNYIEKILDTYDGTQFGTAGLINDDIFALLVLLRAGYTSTDTEVSHAISYVLSLQEPNGSFGSPDITGAALQTLSLVTQETGVSDAIAHAVSYLESIQSSNGGFGDVYGTPWAIQGLISVGVDVSTLSKQGNTPLSYIGTAQLEDGRIGSGQNTASYDIWATAYAVPALLQKPWPSLLSSFSKVQSGVSPTGGSSGASASDDSATQNTTSTLSNDVLQMLGIHSPTSTLSATVVSSTPVTCGTLPYIDPDYIRTTFAQTPEDILSTFINALSGSLLVSSSTLDGYVQIVDVTNADTSTTMRYTIVSRILRSDLYRDLSGDTITVYELLPKAFIESASNILGTFSTITNDPIIAFHIPTSAFASSTAITRSYAVAGDFSAEASGIISLATYTPTTTPSSTPATMPTEDTAVLRDTTETVESISSTIDLVPTTDAIGGKVNTPMRVLPEVAGLKIEEETPELSPATDTEQLAQPEPDTTPTAPAPRSAAFTITLAITVLLGLGLIWRMKKSLV